MSCKLLFVISDYDPFQLEFFYNETQKLPYLWAKDKPLLYVQQIIMKTGKHPFIYASHNV